MNDSSHPLPVQPGQWLGIIGGGQLGRMFCHSAQAMGYKVAVLDPDEHSPAGAVADLHIRASYTDAQGLHDLSSRCTAITTEFENVPAESLESLARTSVVRPSASCVAVVQDRIREKAFIRDVGVPVAPYAAIRVRSDIEAADAALFPGISKAARLGYDGKGQARVATREQALDAYASFGDKPCVLEALLPLASEVSVVMARSANGEIVSYTPARNEHRAGILAVSVAQPAESPARAAFNEQARQATSLIAEALDYVGILCVEFFILEDGSLVANEIAPRPHNSGHYTMNGCITSQFEQQVRVTAGMPLGSTEDLCPVVMLNLMGDIWFDDEGAAREPDWAKLLKIDGVKLHLYGKTEARRGRKMGHVNILGKTIQEALLATGQAAAVLGIAFE